MVVDAVGVVDEDRVLFPAGGGPHKRRARLLPVFARPLAVVGLARDVAPDKWSQGGHRARDDGEVDFDAGPDGDVHSGNYSCLMVRLFVFVC